MKSLYEARNDEIVGSKVVHVWEVDGRDIEYESVIVNVVKKKAEVKVELKYTVLGKDPHFYILTLHGFIADIKLGNLYLFLWPYCIYTFAKDFIFDKLSVDIYLLK